MAIESRRRLIEEEAASWLIERDRGLSEEAAARLDGWIGTSDEHAGAWSRASRLWSSFDDTDPLLDAMRVDALSARPAKRALWRNATLALTTAALAAAGVIGWRTGLGPDPQAPTLIARNAKATLSTGRLGGRSASLPDGSQVTLDSDSALALVFTPGRRDLRVLRGAASFDVRHEIRRPFAVQAAGSIVTATGTRFTVRTLPAGMIATLERGMVVVSRGDEKPVAMRPGEQVTAIAGRPLSISPAKSPAAIARQSGYHEFDDTPLGQAVSDVNGFSDGEHIVVSQDLEDLHVSGRFRLGDAAGFAAAATQILPVKQSRVEGRIKLSRR